MHTLNHGISKRSVMLLYGVLVTGMSVAAGRQAGGADASGPFRRC